MAKPPNILWICTDQQRWDTIHALGNKHIRTPNIDRLVHESTAFDAAFCQSPICTPSRASFLTGLYPSTVHATTNGNIVWGEGAPLVTKLLADAGYDCGLVGKFHLAGGWHRVEPRPKDDGYRVFEWSHAPRDDWPVGHAYKEWLAEKGYDLGELRKDPANIPPHLHRAAWCTERSIAFMEEDRPDDQPWLLTINYYYPHPPFDPPHEYRDRYDAASMPDPLFRESDLDSQRKLAALGVDFQTDVRRPETFDAKGIKAAYYAMIELLDDQVAMLLDSLERTGQRDNTLVLFMSDHGETLGDHGLLMKGCRFYEGLVRVPMIWSWPGHIAPGVVSDALVELTDIMPTLLDVCDVSYPEKMMGRSLLPILTGQTDHHRDTVRCEYYHTLKDDDRGFEGSYATMIRDERYKLVVYHGHAYGELFDLEADPGEFNNLWDDPAYAGVRFQMLLKNFDSLALAVDTGPKQILYS